VCVGDNDTIRCGTSPTTSVDIGASVTELESVLSLEHAASSEVTAIIEPSKTRRVDLQEG
jgi:hypothetical protein